MKTKILIAGAGGQLGQEFVKQMIDEDFIALTALGSAELDITDILQVESVLDEGDYDIFMNCSGFTAVDIAQEKEEVATLLNATAPAQVAAACWKRGVKFIHFSTDYVFDGKADRPYKETDPTSPLNVYGYTKAQGEKWVLNFHPEALIMRVAWLYSDHGKNFFLSMLRLGKEKSELNIVNDQVSSPSYAGFLVEDLLTSLKNKRLMDMNGIYHYSLEGECSWMDFAKQIFEIAGIDCLVNPVTSANFGAAAIRPAYSRLDNSKWVEESGIPAKHWEEGLKACFEEFTKNGN